jgi:putative transposase
LENKVTVSDIVQDPGAHLRGDAVFGEPRSAAGDDQGFAQRMMDAEVEELCGAAYGQVSPDQVEREVDC